MMTTTSAAKIIAGALGGWITLGVALLIFWPTAPPPPAPSLSPYQQAVQHCALAERLTRRYVGNGGTALRSEEYARCLANRVAQIPVAVRP